jgi:hypothetical protein
MSTDQAERTEWQERNFAGSGPAALRRSWLRAPGKDKVAGDSPWHS